MSKTKFKQDMEKELEIFLNDETPWRSIKGSTKDFANIVIKTCEDNGLESAAYAYIKKNKKDLDLMKLAAHIWALLPPIEIVDDDEFDED